MGLSLRPAVSVLNGIRHSDVFYHGHDVTIPAFVQKDQVGGQLYIHQAAVLFPVPPGAIVIHPGAKLPDRRIDRITVRGQANIKQVHPQELFPAVTIITDSGLVNSAEGQRAEIDDPHGVGIVVEITTISEFAFGQPPGVQPDELVQQYAGQQYISYAFYAADE